MDVARISILYQIDLVQTMDTTAAEKENDARDSKVYEADADEIEFNVEDNIRCREPRYEKLSFTIISCGNAGADVLFGESKSDSH